MSNRRPLQICYLAIGLAVIVILMGGWTRIMDAGLGCPDWPGCFGQMTAPISAAHIAEAQHNFSGVEVDVTKGWLEMIHRYMASTLGFLILLLAFIAWQRRKKSDYPVRLSFILLILVICQGLFGMLTVTLKLLPVVVSGHLMGGLLTLTLLIFLAGKLRHAAVPESPPSGRWIMRMAVMVLFMQMLLGGWTSANYAGWACTHWLSCVEGQRTELDFRSGFSFSLDTSLSHQGGTLPQPARAAIQMTHRAGALAVTVVILLAGALALRSSTSRKPALVLFTLLVFQLCMGAANVVYGVPAWLAWIHHAGAVSLLLCLLWLKTRYESEVHYE